MRLNTGRILVRLLALVSLALVVLAAMIALQRTKVHNVIIAAGSARAESFVIVRALKTVVERNYPRLRITVHETGGTSDSLARLERGDAQLAAAQADVTSGNSASIVSVLFEDTFQLLVQKTSNIQQFTELKGKRIALPKAGGQYQSFLFLAGHFGLRESDFVFVGADDDSASVAFTTGDADALFLVRALHSAAVTRLALTGKVTFLPIDQGPALHIEQPAYTPAIIPQGAYAGNPPLPATDLHTIALERILLARRDVSDDAIFAITEVLMERRQELAAAIPQADEAVRSLLSGVKRPDAGIGLEAGIHSGAMAFYEREQRSFVRSHTDLIAIVLGLCLFAWLWVSALKRSASWRQKIRAREYHNTIIQLMEEARSGTSDEHLGPVRAELLMLLNAAIRDLGHDRISEGSFQSFRAIWQIAFDESRTRKISETVAGPPPEGTVTAASARSPELGKPWWKFRRSLQTHTPISGPRGSETVTAP